MLSAFILGLAVGAWWIRRRIDVLVDPLATLARVQVTMGLLTVATLAGYGATFDLMAWAVRALARNQSGYLGFNFLSHAIALLVMLPATICAGMTLPLITHRLVVTGHGEESIGRVYAVNTLGAIVGVVLTVHLLIPATGLDRALPSRTRCCSSSVHARLLEPNGRGNGLRAWSIPTPVNAINARIRYRRAPRCRTHPATRGDRAGGAPGRADADPGAARSDRRDRARRAD